MKVKNNKDQISTKRKHEPDGLQEYEGQNYFKQRLVLSLLSQNPFRITAFRPKIGIKGFEQSLLVLIEKITDGTKYTFSRNGEEIEFYPGRLLGGEVSHECDNERSIGYYLELLIPLALFSKEATEARLFGITNAKDAVSVDYVKRNTMAWLKEVYKIDEGLDLKIIKRGMIPNGGGEVIFSCPIVKELPAVQVMDEGKVKRIRGVAYSCKVPASISNRVVEAAKGYFLDYLNDIYIYTDQNTGKQSGNSPGYGVYLEAETTMGVIYSSEVISEAGEGNHETAEELAVRGCKALMKQIYYGGCIDQANTWLIILFMALSPNDVSKFIVPKLSEYSMDFLRHMYDFFKIKFKIEWNKPADIEDSDSSDSEDDEERDEDQSEDDDMKERPFSIKGAKYEDDEIVEKRSKKKEITDENSRVLLACAGLGYKNMSRMLL